MIVIRSKPTSRDHTMNVRMEQQVLPQVCRMAIIPISAPRRSGFAAISSADAALALNNRL